MLKLENVEWLHLESTTRCNAWCPACPRNKQGFGLADGLIEQDISVDKLTEILNMLPSLTTIQISGTFGDCISGKNFIQLIDLILSYNNIKNIQIHTNGSLKTIQWWSDFADKIKHIKHSVIFALDGLEDTHAIYRQNTNFNKIIENATAFISAGGTAVWQFIPFEHNCHQIKDVIKLSKKLGFSDIIFIKNRVRFHEQSYHYKTGEPVDIKPMKEIKKYNRQQNLPINSKELVKNNKVEFESCMHLHLKSIYVSATGKISNCCYLRNQDYSDIEKNFEDKDWQTNCLRSCGSR
jgi:MoaA/NifB/PqqE/SkfB family radical SAM enzyme